MILAVVLLLFLFGLAIGSFLNVVIYRSVHDESFVHGRSKCPNCKKMIAWYDNVPLLSFFMLKGKCRHCGTQISWSYPVIEFITAILFVWWYLIGFTFFQLSSKPFVILQPAFWLCVGICLVVIFFSDLLYGIIPDAVVVLLGGLGLVYRAALLLFQVMRPEDMAYTLLAATGAALFFWLLWWITNEKGMGLGDVKFMFPLGLIMGWPGTFVGVLSAFILGSLVGIGLILFNKKKFGQTLPFGPFLVAGTVIALVAGDRLVHWYLQML
jgi:leader peptidase (prepilin peptidase)/N-methyltransferase